MHHAHRTTILTVVLLVLGVLPAWAGDQHPIADRLPDIGPEAKRQANYLFDELIQFFERVDEVMTSDDTTSAHMENAYQRATQRHIDAWSERQEKILDAYLRWAKSRGQAVDKLPSEWSAYLNRIAYFLSDMADGRGYAAASWRRELNVVAKRFEKFTEKAPKALEAILKDVGEADTQMKEASASLGKAVATLDEMKQHARHLRRVRPMVKNLQTHLVQQQDRGKEIMSDKSLMPETFQTGLDEVLAWKSEVEADADLPRTAKQVPTYWAQYGQQALDAFEEDYEEVAKLMEDFLAGDLLKDTTFFSGIEYGRMVAVLDDLIAKVDARVAKIQAGS